MKSYITSIGIANPPHCIAQKDAFEFMSENLNLEKEDHRKLKAIYRSSGIDTRYSVISDFGTSRGAYTFFPNIKEGAFPTVLQRMKVFEKFASDLGVQAAKNCLKEENLTQITHVITVSCTGMFAPGIDLEIIEKLGLKRNTERLAINFMGCYAAFNALKAGDAICKSNPNAKVLIICVEFCTLHFQKNSSLDHLFSNAIFGDGAAAVLLEPAVSKGFGLALESFHCDIAPEGKSEMAWHISDFGFEMTLSSYVPGMIHGGIKTLTNNLFSKMEMDLGDVTHFAVHPGGRKILEAIEEALGLSKNDNRYAYDVLRNFGNMSSPTVLFVLYTIFNELKANKTEAKILSFAFGPGLTLESMMLNACYARQNVPASVSEAAMIGSA